MKCPECGEVLKCRYKNKVRGVRYGGVECWRRQWRCRACGFKLRTREITDENYSRLLSQFEAVRQRYIVENADLREKLSVLDTQPYSAEYKLAALRSALRDLLKRHG